MTLEKAQAYFDQRERETHINKRLALLNKDSSDRIASDYAEDMERSLDSALDSTGASNEERIEILESAAEAAESIVNEMNAEIPERVRNVSYKEDATHSRAVTATQKFMFTDGFTPIFTGIISKASQTLSKDIKDSGAEMVDVLQNTLKLSANTRKLIGDSLAGNVTDSKSAGKDLFNNIVKIKEGTITLQGAHNRSGFVPKERYEQLLREYLEVDRLLPYGLFDKSKDVNVYGDSKNIVDRSARLRERLTIVSRRADAIGNIQDKFAKEAAPNDIFNRNYNMIYRYLDSSLSALKDVADAADDRQDKTRVLLNKTKSSITKALTVMGILNTTDIFQKVENISSNVSSYLNQLTGYVNFSKELYANIDYSVRAIKNINDKVSSLIMREKITQQQADQYTDALDNMESQIEANHTQLAAQMNMATDYIRDNAPEPTSEGELYLKELKECAPASFDYLMMGDIASFSYSLTSPMMTTHAGAAAQELNDIVLRKQREGTLTVEDKNRIAILTSYLNGEHKRALLATNITSAQTQRNEAADSLQTYLDVTLTPLREMADKLARETAQG